MRFQRTPPDVSSGTAADSRRLTKLLHTIGQRVARLLERLGLLVRDADSDHLDFEPGEAFDRLVGASIHYRIAIGPNADRKALTSRTVPVQSEPFPSTLLARLPGFSLHAATVCEAAQRDKLEKLCRHIARPAIANERLSTNDRGQVIYRFKQPFRDGSTHVVLDPLDFIARPAALVPRPRLNLTRFHGVFAPNCKHRESVVPKREPRHEKPDKPLAPMTWMRRLKRVFAFDISEDFPRAPRQSTVLRNHPVSSGYSSYPQRAESLAVPLCQFLRGGMRGPGLRASLTRSRVDQPSGPGYPSGSMRLRPSSGDRQSLPKAQAATAEGARRRCKRLFISMQETARHQWG